MLKLEIAEELRQEFETVSVVWNSHATTRRVDSLLLSWVKYEKQLRRLFCFLVYQHPRISESSIERIINSLVERTDLYPETFAKGISALAGTTVAELIGDDYNRLAEELKRIKKIRNKLMHGQITGTRVQSPQLERDVRSLVQWITYLARGASTEFGYDGLGRNTFRKAKASFQIAVDQYPFATAAEFSEWLEQIAPRRRTQRTAR